MVAFCAGHYCCLQPERLDAQHEYDIRADVWSVGISLVELARGEYPYRGCNSEFEVLTRIVSDPAPELKTEEGFSPLFCDFEHSWLEYYETANVDVAAWYQTIVQS
ncbi:unnamed protein product [Gongylonema pulchrum]|uniref:mitogen-activated protein kinase kinase n=1 Tax=Gongylonema pulchrum TaxID=637853 RepID=A0A183ELL1_9BILA|nr:unnamed protein product [Gongylonema pulchrum]